VDALPRSAVFRRRGAQRTIHHVKVNARWRSQPRNAYEAMVRFQRQFPNRATKLRAPRAGAESTYAVTKGYFGNRLVCRHPIGKKNEVIAKKIGNNLRRILQLQIASQEVTS
jgi:hypothetical protein